MISENREFSEKKGVAFVSVVGIKKINKKKNLSIQTMEMNWKVLCHAFTESLSSLMSPKVNAMICVAKLHSQCDKGNYCDVGTHRWRNVCHL